MKYVLIFLFWLVPSIIGDSKPDFKTLDPVYIKPLPKKNNEPTSLKTIKFKEFDYVYESIKKSEGCSLVPIRIKETTYVGYGRMVFPGEEYLLKGVTQYQADSLLINDVKNINKLVKGYFKEDSLNIDQLEAVTRLTYAIGIGNLRKSSLYRKIKNNQPIEENDFTYWAFNKTNDLKYTKSDYKKWNGELKK
jgi:GH24 family phage-related lysozyme (muramidase)